MEKIVDATGAMCVFCRCTIIAGARIYETANEVLHINCKIQRDLQMANTERDIIKVIDAVLAHVPAQRSELRAQLEWVKEDVSYRAPEVRGRCWQLLVEALRKYCNNPPTLPWEIRISDIVEGRAEV